MSILAHAPVAREPRIVGWESMYRLIRQMGLLPFFENPIPGFSVEEHTDAEHWFTEDNLGPWDWKIDCLQTGDIVYGKYLWGGKAAFATVPVYRELMHYRRSLPKYAPTPQQQPVLDLLAANGSVTIADVRKLLGVKKSAADALMTRLQMGTRVVTGDIRRVYRGSDLHYNGWQRSDFCRPDDLYEDLSVSHSPEESFRFLCDLVRRTSGDIPDKILFKLLG